jgi:hypothetical protein
VRTLVRVFGAGDEHRAAAQRVALLDHAQLSVQEVDVIDFETEHFAESQPAPGRDIDRRPEPIGQPTSSHSRETVPRSATTCSS